MEESNVSMRPASQGGHGRHAASPVRFRQCPRRFRLPKIGLRAAARHYPHHSGIAWGKRHARACKRKAGRSDYSLTATKPASHSPYARLLCWAGTPGLLSRRVRETRRRPGIPSTPISLPTSCPTGSGRTSSRPSRTLHGRNDPAHPGFPTGGLGRGQLADRGVRFCFPILHRTAQTKRLLREEQVTSRMG
ncbi:MAG: hypothetical protein JWO59_1833 [Chloroflexi bacterium]|nr:hypothetical protein [Chloroflexota bacterium]